MKSIICACITIGLVRLAAVAIRVANMHPVYVYDGVLFHLLYSLIRYAEGGFVYVCGLRVFNRCFPACFTGVTRGGSWLKAATTGL